MIKVPNLDPMYDQVFAYVKEHQGEKGYIDVQPYQENPGDTIYTFIYCTFSDCFEERMVYGVRVKDDNLEVCFEPFMRSYRIIYDNDDFEAAEWYSVRWGDVLYIPTIFNLAENIEEYGE